MGHTIRFTGEREEETMKPFSNTELSDRKCSQCGDLLKKNLLEKRPNAHLDWKCFYPMETARKGGHGKGRQDRRFEGK
jgi:hypothetical protein